MNHLPLLSLLLLIPFLGSAALLAWPGDPSASRMRTACIALLTGQLVVSLAVLLCFDTTQPGLQLQEIHSWVPGIGLDYRLGVDGLSLPLVIINGEARNFLCFRR